MSTGTGGRRGGVRWVDFEKKWFDSRSWPVGEEEIETLIEDIKKAGRIELLEAETKELEIISSFLPEQLSEEDTKKLCEEAIKKVGASSIKDMGKVMGDLKKTHGDVLDFSKVGSIIKTVLK